MNSAGLTPWRAIGLLGLVLVSYVVSMAAAAAIETEKLQGLLVPMGFLLVTIPLAYVAVRWTDRGWIRWAALVLILALPIVVGVQLIAFRVL